MIDLVKSSPEYAELWHRWRSEPSMVRYNPLAQTRLEDLRIRMAKVSSDLSNLKNSEEFQFFIRFQEQLVGTLSLKNISHMMMYGEIGYDVGESFQGKGIGTRAVSLFVEKIFAETPLRRLIAYVAEGNLASRRLLEKVGFLQEGICREHFIINGKPTDEIMFGILRSEWEERTNLRASPLHPLISIDHTRLVVKDIEQSKKWYTQALGIAPWLDTPDYVEFRIGPCGLSMSLSDAKSPHSTGGQVAYWRVRAVDQAIEFFSAYGAKVFRGPLDIENDEAICQIRDPFGNVIGLIGKRQSIPSTSE